VHVAISFSSRRDEEIRKALGQAVLKVLLQRIGGPDLKVSRSVEIRQFEPGMYFNDYDLKEGGANPNNTPPENLGTKGRARFCCPHLWSATFPSEY
jgi:hypothetical protein